MAVLLYRFVLLVACLAFALGGGHCSSVSAIAVHIVTGVQEWKLHIKQSTSLHADLLGMSGSVSWPDLLQGLLGTKSAFSVW